MKAPYRKRLWTVTKGIALGWRQLPERCAPLAESAMEFWRDLVWALMAILIPLTFWLSPFWLWLLERDEEKSQKDAAERLKAYSTGLRGESESQL